MSIYEKKPVRVEAVLFIKLVDIGFMNLQGALFEERVSWLDDNQEAWEPNKKVTEGKWRVVSDGIEIGTLEGSHLASPGDYIIKGTKEELYPCKPDIFRNINMQVVSRDEVREITGTDPEDNLEISILTHDGRWFENPSNSDEYYFEWNQE